MTWFYFVGYWMLVIFGKVWFRFQAVGRERVPLTGPVILASNHASNLDPIMVGISLKRACHYLAKEELFRIPVLGFLIRGMNAHPIRRGALQREALKSCISIVQGGGALILFPEGTRTHDGRLQPMRAGLSLIASHAHAPVVPVYVHGTYQAMPRGVSFPRFRKVHVYFGNPIPGEDRELMSKVTAQLQELEAKCLGARDIPEPAPISRREEV